MGSCSHRGTARRIRADEAERSDGDGSGGNLYAARYFASRSPLRVSARRRKQDSKRNHAEPGVL